MSFPHVAHGADKGSVEAICPPVGSIPKTRLLAFLALTLFSIHSAVPARVTRSLGRLFPSSFEKMS